MKNKVLQCLAAMTMSWELVEVYKNLYSSRVLLLLLINYIINIMHHLLMPGKMHRGSWVKGLLGHKT